MKNTIYIRDEPDEENQITSFKDLVNSKKKLVIKGKS